MKESTNNTTQNANGKFDRLSPTEKDVVKALQSLNNSPQLSPEQGTSPPGSECDFENSSDSNDSNIDTRIQMKNLNKRDNNRQSQANNILPTEKLSLYERVCLDFSFVS